MKVNHRRFMAKKINHRGHEEHSPPTEFKCLLRPQGVQVTESRCFFSVFSVVFRTSPEDNKKSHIYLKLSNYTLRLIRSIAIFFS